MASTNNPLFRVKAAYDYTSAHEDDLSFAQGQIISVTEEEGDEWYVGEYIDGSGNTKSGLFPSNFVERYEPAPPPRPARSARPKAPEPPPEDAVLATVSSPPAQTHASFAVDDVQPIATPKVAQSTFEDADHEATQESSVSSNAAAASVRAGDATIASPRAISKSPPPVAAKSSSFKDRIAAFNKTTAAPPAPFKPSALGSSGFIKKPFVAPPPSRNAYVPPPTRDVAPQTIYRREEDPEIAERQAQDIANAERAGLIPTAEDDDEDSAAKPVSLKERIALLQKQQMEQAARRGEAAAKEKPKKPKKRSDTQDDDEEGTPIAEVMARSSMDGHQQEPAAMAAPRVPQIPAGHLQEVNHPEPLSAASHVQPQGFSYSPAEDEETQQPDHVEVEEEIDDEDEDEDDEIDEETRHQMALRQRMAKLSGGMGMPGMFGPPGGMPMMGMASQKQRKRPQEAGRQVQAVESTPVMARPPSIPTMAKPSVEDERLQQAVTSPSPGSESDDEFPGTSSARHESIDARAAPLPPVAPPVPQRQPSIHSEPLGKSNAERSSAIYADTSLSSMFPNPTGSVLPPIANETVLKDESEYEGDYDTDIASSTKHKNALNALHNDSSMDESTLATEPAAESPRSVPKHTAGMPLPLRPVPPPPPPAVPQHRPSLDASRGSLAEVANQDLRSPTEDDDYDPYRYGPPNTRLGASGPSSPSLASPSAPVPIAPPPNPPPATSRPDHVAPPPMPAAIPTTPQVPPAVHESSSEEDDALVGPAGITSSPAIGTSSARDHFPQRTSSARLMGMHSARSSVDAERSSIQRRSTDQQRLSISNEYIASDINVGEASGWWAKPQQLPPVLQDRNDIFFESEETIVQKRGGKSLVNKDIYVLFRDYSQTVISVRYDSKNPSDVSFEQRHEAPPPPMRHDQLESAYNMYGAKLADAANAKQNSVVGDGSSQSLIVELVRGFEGALPPVGTRAYGALVYSNLANATVQQFDEIRPGDIVSFRNAKFQGKHSGVMHQKYQLEAGKPDHAAIVLEWDGTKKKIRAIEQGRDSKKCKAESFRLGDLRSGEVRVWRLMNRSWVGWESESS